MSKLIVEMEMPRVCITENGYYGYCPMDRVWCIQRNAPPDITTREAYEAMTDKIPSWCPIVGVLPETHGRLIDEAVFCENVVKYSHQSTKTIGKALDATPTIIEMTPIVTERKDDEQIH